MSQVFFTADLHFNHDYVARTRAFYDHVDHDEYLITEFNQVVTKRDQVWILGDLGMGSLTKVLKKASFLHGTKHLVLGNHDPGHPMHKGSHNKMRRYLEVFESVSLHEQVKIQGRKVNLSHFPYYGDHYDEDRYNAWRLRDEGIPLLCGHVHHAWARKSHQFNVGVDFYRHPYSTNEIFSRMKRAEIIDG